MRHNGAVPRRITTVLYYDVIPHPTSGNILTQYRHPRVQHDTLGQHFRAFPLPKGAGQNEVWMKETLRQRKPHLSSPKSAVRLPWATLSYIFVAQECSTAPLGNTFVLYRRPRVQHGSLGQHFRTSSSPEGTARLSWATLSYIFVARGCSTARLSDTSARFHRPKVLGKRRKVESDKKRRSLPKKRGRLRSGAQSRARTGTSLRDIGF